MGGGRAWCRGRRRWRGWWRRRWWRLAGALPFGIVLARRAECTIRWQWLAHGKLSPNAPEAPEAPPAGVGLTAAQRVVRGHPARLVRLRARQSWRQGRGRPRRRPGRRRKQRACRRRWRKPERPVPARTLPIPVAHAGPMLVRHRLQLLWSSALRKQLACFPQARPAAAVAARCRPTIPIGSRARRRRWERRGPGRPRYRRWRWRRLHPVVRAGPLLVAHARCAVAGQRPTHRKLPARTPVAAIVDGAALAVWSRALVVEEALRGHTGLVREVAVMGSKRWARVSWRCRRRVRRRRRLANPAPAAVVAR